MTQLRSPLFWFFVAVVGVLAGFLIHRSLSSRSWGFKGLVKNPDLWNKMSNNRSEVEKQTQAAQDWSSPQIADAVRHFVFDVKSGRDAWGEKRILISLEARVHPAIIAVLQDASVRPKLTVPAGTDLMPEAPLNRLCDLLAERPPVEVVDLLAPFLNEPSSQIRKDVALVIGNVGTPSIIELLRKALSDADEYVRSYALMGLRRAMKDGHLDDRCKIELFRDLQQLIAEGKNADVGASLLLEFEKQRAVDFFLSEEIFTPKSKSLHKVLEAMGERKLPVPRERLLALISELEVFKLEYPRTYTLGAALRLLGQHQKLEDRPFLEARMAHSEDRVAEGAASGLVASQGLEGFQQQLWDKESADGFNALSLPQRHFSAVNMLDGEVNNGGHAQYFVNSGGDHWKKALEGLEAMGCAERAVILREAIGKFGKNGPSINRQTRQLELAKLARKDDTLFESLDSRYYKCSEVIDVATARYAIHNAEAFK